MNASDVTQPVLKDERTIPEIIAEEIEKNLTIEIVTWKNGSTYDIDVHVDYKGKTICKSSDNIDLRED